MATFNKNSFEEVRQQTSLIFREAAGMAGPHVIGIEMMNDPIEDQIKLYVSYKLFDRHELQSGDWLRKIWPMLTRYLKLDPLPAKAIRAERRQLIRRAQDAARAKPRPRIKASKK